MRVLTGLAAIPAILLAACTLSSGPGSAKLTFPAKGVVCDPGAGFCSDRVGISLGISEAELGETDAYKAFIAKHSKDDFLSLQTQNYQFSDGTLCDHVEMWCGDPRTGEPNIRVAEALFAG